VAQGGIDIDPLVGQQPVDLLDRMLGRQPARQRQAMPDRADRQRAGPDHTQSGVGQRLNALGMHVTVEQADERAMNLSKRLNSKLILRQN
jgi:hypothetical protein